MIATDESPGDWLGDDEDEDPMDLLEDDENVDDFTG